MTKLYLSGPMTGRKDHNFPAFNEAAKRLRDAGYEVENPAELGEVDGWQWEDYLKRDIPVMLQCDGVALLPGWEDSAGASLEVLIAIDVGIRAKLVEWWLNK